MSKADKILERVRALLAKAEGTEFEGEAAVFRAKADELMTAHAIEAWQLATDEQGQQPERRDVDTSWYWDKNLRPIRDDLWMLFVKVGKHCRCKVVNWVGYNSNPVLGLPADLDYFDLLFTHLQFQLMTQIHPDVREGESLIDALVRMKEAGMKWEVIGERLIRAGLLEGPYKRSMGVKFTKMYTDHCEATGRERKYINPKTYQRSFAEGFCMQVGVRLRNQAAKQSKAVKSSGMELVVRDLRKALDEMAEDMFGKNPMRGSTVSTSMATDQAGLNAGSVAGRNATITQHQGHRVGARKEIEA